MIQNFNIVVSFISFSGKVRTEAEEHPELKDAFLSSLEKVKSLVGGRFESMMLKDNQIVCPKPCDEEAIVSLFESLKKIDHDADVEKLTAADLANLPSYTKFIKDHCTSTTYTFQIKKCTSSSCSHCTEYPIRLPQDLHNSLHFIPAPLLDSNKEHFQKFDQVYGGKVSEKDLPSLKFSIELIEEDKVHKELMTAQKVRAVVKCALCQKPRYALSL